MNVKLLQALARFSANPAQMNREEVSKLIRESAIVDSGYDRILSDVQVMEGIKMITAEYIESAIASATQDGRFGDLILRTELSKATRRLVNNKSFMLVIQTLLLIAFAIMKEAENGRPEHI